VCRSSWISINCTVLFKKLNNPVAGCSNFSQFLCGLEARDQKQEFAVLKLSVIQNYKDKSALGLYLLNWDSFCEHQQIRFMWSILRGSRVLQLKCKNQSQPSVQNFVLPRVGPSLLLVFCTSFPSPICNQSHTITFFLLLFQFTVSYRLLKITR
jgi:hypothetical protein